MTVKLGKTWNQEDRRLQEVQEKKKPILLKELQNELKHLDQVDHLEYLPDQDPTANDHTLQRLQMISRQAKRLEIAEIEKLCRLAIGKRILNLQLKRKKDEHNLKLRKKEKIELFFRQNRIKRFDYPALMEQRLAHSTLIVRAYENGKGFVQSDRPYRDHCPNALQQCDFLSNIREVNRIFYGNYSGAVREGVPLGQTLLKWLWVPLLAFLIMGLTLPFISFPNEQVIVIALLGVIMAVLFYVAVGNFKNKPSDNNQIEQSVVDVRTYFQKINRESQRKGTNIEWTVSSDFMYLEVIFHNGFP